MGTSLRQQTLGLLALFCLVASALGNGNICEYQQAVPIDQVCALSGLASGNPETGCQVVTILGDLIPLTQPPMCKSSPHVAGGIALPDSEDSYGIMLPQDLPDVRTYHQGLPQNLDQEAYMKAEGATYYWYYRTLLSFTNWAPCTLEQQYSNSSSTQTPPKQAPAKKAPTDKDPAGGQKAQPPTQAPKTGQQPAAGKQPAPATKQPAPATKQPAPTTDKPAPAEQAPKGPAAGTKKPAPSREADPRGKKVAPPTNSNKQAPPTNSNNKQVPPTNSNNKQQVPPVAATKPAPVVKKAPAKKKITIVQTAAVTADPAPTAADAAKPDAAVPAAAKTQYAAEDDFSGDNILNEWFDGSVAYNSSTGSHNYTHGGDGEHYTPYYDPEDLEPYYPDGEEPYYNDGDSYGGYGEAELPVPKGWRVEKLLDIPKPEGGLEGSDEQMPFAMVLKPEPDSYGKRRESCHRWYSYAAKALVQGKAVGAAKRAAMAAMAASHVEIASFGGPGGRRLNEAGPVPGAPTTPAMRLKQMQRKREQEEQQKREIEALAKKEAEDRLRKEQEERLRKEQEEKLKQEAEAKQKELEKQKALEAERKKNETAAAVNKPVGHRVVPRVPVPIPHAHKEEPGSGDESEWDFDIRRGPYEHPHEGEEYPYRQYYPGGSREEEHEEEEMYGAPPHHHPHYDGAPEGPHYHHGQYEHPHDPYYPHDEQYKPVTPPPAHGEQSRHDPSRPYTPPVPEYHNQEPIVYGQEPYHEAQHDARYQVPEQQHPSRDHDEATAPEPHHEEEEKKTPEGYQKQDASRHHAETEEPKERKYVAGGDSDRHHHDEAHDSDSEYTPHYEQAPTGSAPKDASEHYTPHESEHESDKSGEHSDDHEQYQQPKSEEAEEEEDERYVEEPAYWAPDEAYDWESARYGDDYTCGSDDSDAPAPGLVILLRGSVAAWEFALDAQYYTTDNHTETFGPKDSQIHAGYLYAAEAVWYGGLDKLVTAEVEAGCRSVTLAGWSLGSAVAQLLAVSIENLIASVESRRNYAAHYDGSKPSPVTVVSFGANTVGDHAWATNFNKKINARNILFAGDLLARFPCEPSTVGCIDPIVGQPFAYERTAGNIVFPGSAMPCNNKYEVAQSWSALEVVTGPQICNPEGAYFNNAMAGHLCSYLCMTSQFVEGAHNNLCWLDGSVPAPHHASVCNYKGGSPSLLPPGPRVSRPLTS